MLSFVQRLKKPCAHKKCQLKNCETKCLVYPSRLYLRAGHIRWYVRTWMILLDPRWFRVTSCRLRHHFIEERQQCDKSLLISCNNAMEQWQLTCRCNWPWDTTDLEVQHQVVCVCCAYVSLNVLSVPPAACSYLELPMTTGKLKLNYISGINPKLIIPKSQFSYSKIWVDICNLWK